MFLGELDDALHPAVIEFGNGDAGVVLTVDCETAQLAHVSLAPFDHPLTHSAVGTLQSEVLFAVLVDVILWVLEDEAVLVLVHLCPGRGDWLALQTLLLATVDTLLVQGVGLVEVVATPVAEVIHTVYTRYRVHVVVQAVAELHLLSLGTVGGAETLFDWTVHGDVGSG